MIILRVARRSLQHIDEGTETEYTYKKHKYSLVHIALYRPQPLLAHCGDYARSDYCDCIEYSVGRLYHTWGHKTPLPPTHLPYSHIQIRMKFCFMLIIYKYKVCCGG